MKIQNFHKKTIRHRKNSGWLQWAGQSEKTENNTKLKILKFQENYNKPSPVQGLERFYKVTPCNEKCNFFILLSFINFFTHQLKIFVISSVSKMGSGSFLFGACANHIPALRGVNFPIIAVLIPVVPSA